MFNEGAIVLQKTSKVVLKQENECVLLEVHTLGLVLVSLEHPMASLWNHYCYIRSEN